MKNEIRKKSYTLSKFVNRKGVEVEYFRYIGCVKSPKTHNERKANNGILLSIEDLSIAREINNKIHRRNRKCGLAHANDDIASDVYNKGKSWKHYSKRQKQWKEVINEPLKEAY